MSVLEEYHLRKEDSYGEPYPDEGIDIVACNDGEVELTIVHYDQITNKIILNRNDLIYLLKRLED